MKQMTWQPFVLPELQTAAKERLHLLLPSLFATKAACRTANDNTDSVVKPIASQLPGPALDAFGIYVNDKPPTCDEVVLADQVRHLGVQDGDGGSDGCAHDDVGDEYADTSRSGTTGTWHLPCRSLLHQICALMPCRSGCSPVSG